MAREQIGNVHEFTVSELSGAVKRTIEENFGLVRVRGELGRVTRAASGHVYLDLKDEKATLSSVIWRGAADRLKIRPEQGMEVVATGRMTTFAGQSRYQLVIDSLEPAGVGALMALLEERKKKLADEGLFAPERKRPIPFLPDVIGVVTSPSGAVIRDILHRLRERFARHVIVWPTLVQGRGAEDKIAAAIAGFNRLGAGDVPRPDVLIVARGGGSLEDLWCFNEEVVARAVAESDIPIISAVGHETDTTLIDYVADRRAPTPTAAAEFATPVRAELLSELLNKERRMVGAVEQAMTARRDKLRAAERGLGRPEDILGAAQQTVDRRADQLTAALRARASRAQTALASAAGRLSGEVLRQRAAHGAESTDALGERLVRAMRRQFADHAQRLADRGQRVSADAIIRLAGEHRSALDRLGDRLAVSGRRAVAEQRARMDHAARLLESYSYTNVLDRGFALVRDETGALVRRADAAPATGPGALQFADGERAITFGAGGKAKPTKSAPRPKQHGLFD